MTTEPTMIVQRMIVQRMIIQRMIIQRSLSQAIKFSIVVLMLLSCIEGNAQFFDAGFVLGPSFSQIEGDDVAGYKKLGINAGVMVEANFSEEVVASMEILYVQKGSASILLNNQDFTNDFRIIHEYVEIPFVVSYQDRGGMNFGAGLAPAYHIRSRLFSLGEEQIGFFDPPFEVRKWGVGAVVNLSYRLNRFSHVNLRWTYDIIPYQDRFSVNRNEVVGQYNNSVALRYVFLMSAIGKKKI